MQLLLHLSRDPHVRKAIVMCQTHVSSEILCLTIKHFIPHYYNEILVSVIFVRWNILDVCCLQQMSFRTCRKYFRQYFWPSYSLQIFPQGSLCKFSFCWLGTYNSILCEHACRSVWRRTWSYVCNEGIRTRRITAPLFGRRESKFRISITVCAMSLCLFVYFYFSRSLCLSFHFEKLCSSWTYFLQVICLSFYFF